MRKIAVKKKVSKIEEEKSICTCCGKEKKVSDFYLSKSILHKASGRMSLCKLCIGKIYNDYLSRYQDTREAIYYMCRKLDIGYSESILRGAITEIENGKKTAVYQIYMTKFNSIGDLNGAGVDFDASDMFIDNESEEDQEEQIIKSERALTEKDLVDRWGYGWTLEELQWLEKDYYSWSTRHECNSLSLERLFEMICVKELEIRNARQDKKPTDKLEKSLRELLSDSNLTPKNMSTLNESESTKSFGLWIKDIEAHRPAEYFEDKKIYDDHDGIGEYFERFVLRPMKNLLVGTREFDKEFNVEDEDGEN